MKARSMILAAGRGTRMGTLSETCPKPLVAVDGKPMIDRALDAVAAAALGPTVVNMHHLADRIETHLAQAVAMGRVILSDERSALLETGGGVKKARGHFDGDRMLVINGDAVWTDGAHNTLLRLWQAFDPDVMDMLLLAVPRGLALGYDGPGDLILGSGPRAAAVPAWLRGAEPATHHMFGGIFVARPALYDTAPEGAFSNKLLFQRAAEARRLYALEHTGNWMHVGTPEAIGEAEAVLARFRAAQK